MGRGKGKRKEAVVKLGEGGEEETRGGEVENESIIDKRRGNKERK